ncbi:MAG: ATP-binding protein [Desulfopila sp.]|jgi:PAS domain S-box-containing protein|nr:ATP-binding protein [Desulfopila sp.]
MVQKLIENINRKIARKLGLWVIVFSVVVTVIASAIQLYLVYRQDLKDIKEYFDSISAVQLTSLSQSVWILDDIQIQAHLNGITQGRDIIYAAVEIDGVVRWHSGEMKPKKTMGLQYPLSYLYRDSRLPLGNLEIVAGLDSLHNRLTKNALIILLINSLKTFLFAGCILLFFRYAVTRHLEKLASHVVNMDFRRKVTPLQLDRKSGGTQDEFSQVVHMLNILQRRGYHAFNALQKSELRLRLFFDATEEGILGVNREARITFANSACLEKIGYENTPALIGKRIPDIISYFPGNGGAPNSGRASYLTPLLTGQTLLSEDGRLEVKGGPVFYAAVRAYPIISAEEITGAVIFFRDITMQREMVREKNLLSQAVRQSPLLVVIFNREGRIDYVNPGFEKITGYDLQEVMGLRSYFLGSFFKNKKNHREIRASLSSGEKWKGVYVLKTRNGAELSLDSLIAPVFNSRGEIINVIALCLDITQTLVMEKQLHHAQKMEAVGRLSASFAHEFGNPLLGVRSVLKDISDRVEMSTADKHLLELAYAECERMKTLIRNFQRFQSDGSDEKKLHDIHEILNNVLTFYQKHFEKNSIQLIIQYDEDIHPVLISKNQITQVFLNLVINAVDSMADGGGVLEVTTVLTETEVLINVHDTGIGIAETEVDFIFEPFYTTKPDVQGTGLGLAVSYGIIAAHGGEITVSSRINEGTTFTVRLPLGF